jgi:hypothetical protein
MMVQSRTALVFVVSGISAAQSGKEKQSGNGGNFPSYSNEVRERRGGCEADGVVSSEQETETERNSSNN